MTTTFKPEDTRPFNLEHARAGAPICMRNGDPVTILKWDMKNTFPIVGVISEEGKEWTVTWCRDGSYSKNEEGELPKDLVMLPNGYVDGKPVYVGDTLICASAGAQHEYSFIVGPDMIDRFLGCKWPESETEFYGEDEKEADTVTLTKSEMAHVVWAYKQLAENSFRLDSAEHVKALREIAVKHGGLMEGKGKAPDEVTLKPLRDYQQALVDEVKQSFADAILPGHEVTLVAGTGNHGAIIDEEPKASLDFIDTILPKDFPVKFAEPSSSFQDAVTDLDQKVEDACSVPAELLKSDDDRAETAWLTYLSKVNGSALIAHNPREAFKRLFNEALEQSDRWQKQCMQLTEVKKRLEFLTKRYNSAIRYADDLQYKINGFKDTNKVLNETNIQQADSIRLLTEANELLEAIKQQYIDDNAKLDKALNEQMSETGRWMAEAKKLCDEANALNINLSAELRINYIEWTGGDCPVSPTNVVKVIFRNGSTWQVTADGINWSHTDSRVNWSDHVVGYKVVK